MASVEIQNVRKSYGPLEVVHGVSLDIPDGAFVVLLDRRVAESRPCCG